MHKVFTLLFVPVLSTIILMGCDRQLVSPIAPIELPQPNTQFEQRALSDLADTATKHRLINLANAASGLAEVLATEDGTTSVQPVFSKLHAFAVEANLVHHTLTKCGIDFGELASLSAIAVKAYTKRINGADMKQALQNLAQGAETAKTALQQLPMDNTFIPFTFGYDYVRKPPDYAYGVIGLDYDTTIRAFDETKRDVIALLEHKGYTVTPFPFAFGAIELNVPVDPFLLFDELIVVPGVAGAYPWYFPIKDIQNVGLGHHVARAYPWYFPGPVVPAAVPLPPPPNFEIVDRVMTRYNKAWCQGNFDVIDDILIEESGLDFFDYSFLLNLADIYAEEIPEAAERIQMKVFPVRSIAIEFLGIYFEHSEQPLDELIEIFRQSVRNGYVSIDHKTVPYYDH